MNLVVELLGPAVGAAIMIKSTFYTAMIIGLTIEFSSVFILFWVPETLRSNSSDMSETSQAGTFSSHSQQEETTKAPWMIVQSWFSSVRTTGTFISTHRHVACAIPAFLINRLGRQLLAWMLQYVSKRQRWSFAVVSS